MIGESTTTIAVRTAVRVLSKLDPNFDRTNVRIINEIAEIIANDFRLGTTGKFPEGKSYSDDEGELRFAIGHDNDNVILRFGKSVQWLAFPPETARALVKSILEHADECERMGHP